MYAIYFLAKHYNQMNIEEQIDNTITSLKIIAMVQKNGRLCIRKGQLAIEPDDRLQAIRRWFNRDSRDQLLLHLRNTINNAVKLSRAILQQQLEVELRPWALQRLLAEMTNSQNGLVNLKTTYADDPAMVAAIDVLIERLSAHCQELQCPSGAPPPSSFLAPTDVSRKPAPGSEAAVDKQPPPSSNNAKPGGSSTNNNVKKSDA